MTLDEYLREQKITETDFAVLIDVTQPTVNRLRKGQIPSRELMATIVKKTDGKVRADDFFGTVATHTPSEAPGAQAA